MNTTRNIDTTILDIIFQDFSSIPEEYWNVMDSIRDALKAEINNPVYASDFYEIAGFSLMDAGRKYNYEWFNQWGQHFIKVAGALDRNIYRKTNGIESIKTKKYFKEPSKFQALLKAFGIFGKAYEKYEGVIQ